jgi:hypothetical protein
MITDVEKVFIKGWLEEYPAGVYNRQWGYGPLEKYGSGSGEVLTNESKEVIMKYG